MDQTKLSTEILKMAYAGGYFPMPHPQTQEILWYNPDPRAIIPLDGFHVSRSLRHTLAKGIFSTTTNQDFCGVMAGCADRPETWINEEFKAAYYNLHKEGYAHSLEVWHNGTLAGGVYGVTLGSAFFAESMFHTVRDASKIALYQLIARLKQCGFVLLEVQFLTDHLASLGAIEIPSVVYRRLLHDALKRQASFAMPPSSSGAL